MSKILFSIIVSAMLCGCYTKKVEKQVVAPEREVVHHERSDMDDMGDHDHVVVEKRKEVIHHDY